MRVVLLEAGGDPRASGTAMPPEPPARDYDVPAFHPLRLRKRRRCAGISSSATTPTTAQQATRLPKYAAAGRRHSVPARRHARRLHRAQRDDPGLRRTTPTGTASPQLTGDPSWRAGNMRRYFERLENCRHRPLERCLAPVGIDRDRPRLGRLAATEKALPRDAIGDVDLVRIVRRLGARRICRVGAARSQRCAMLSIARPIRTTGACRAGCVRRRAATRR